MLHCFADDSTGEKHILRIECCNNYFEGEIMKWIHIAILYTAAVLIFGCLMFSINKAKNTPVEKALKKLLTSALISVAAYATAMVVNEPLISEYAYGLYHIFLDGVVMAMVSFVRRYTGIQPKLKKEGHILGVLVTIDTFFLLLNPIVHLVFRVAPVDDGFGKGFYSIVSREPLYNYHFVLLAFLILLALFRLGRKTASTPKIYKFKYAIISIMLCVAFVSHLVYLNCNFKFDYSLFLYGVIAIAIYYFSLAYIPQGLMERLMYFTISSLKDGVICMDVDGNIAYSNKMAREYFSDEMEDNSKLLTFINLWFGENPDAAERDIVWESPRRIGGKKRYYKNSYTRIIDENQKYIGCFFIMHDCTTEYNRIEEEQYRATHDELTGLYNMYYFCERASEMINDNPETDYMIVCTDVKSFKVINDIFGIETGDELLKALAASIAKIATNNCIYGRITGDRFALCIRKEDFSEELLIAKAEELSNFFDKEVFKMHVHFGVYEVRDRSMKVSVMCDRANIAIRTIKDSYETVIAYYDSQMREKFISKQKIISEFENALDTGRFHPFIQPQFSADRKTNGGEALVRWILPDGGMVRPDQFISVFEETGLIGRLDTYMWERACMQLDKWRKEGRNELYLSVNISPKDFCLMDVYEVITALVKKYDLNPKNLHLEITETAIIENLKANLPLINKLRDAGFQVEMDDFGNGQSSLNSLMNIDVDVLKVDMGFLRKTENVERSMTILRKVIELARSLDLKLIIEGVETQEQVDFLIKNGCDVFQGFHFARPMKISDFEDKYLSVQA